MWLFKEKGESSADVDKLNLYNEILSTSCSFVKGNIITLRNESFIPKDYGGCSTDINKENYYALVLSVYGKNSLDKKVLGENHDIEICTVFDNMIQIKCVDSRLFREAIGAYNFINHQGLCILKDFMKDTPISSIQKGILVRPRSHINIKLKQPFMIIGESVTNDVRVIGEDINGMIYEFSVQQELLCEYSKK